MGNVGDKKTENEVLLLEHDVKHDPFSPKAWVKIFIVYINYTGLYYFDRSNLFTRSRMTCFLVLKLLVYQVFQQYNEVKSF